MKILAICHWNLANPDAETIRKIELNAALTRGGADVTLLAPGLGRYPKKCNFPIYYVPCFGGRLSPHLYIISLLVPLLLFILVRRPRVVYVSDYTFSFPLLLLLRFFGCTVVVEVNGVMARDARRLGIVDPFRLFAIDRFSKIGLRLASKLICVSEEIQDYVVSEVGIDHESVFLIPNGVNTEMFQVRDREECRERLNLRVGSFTVGFVGGFLPWQGVLVLLRAFARLLEEVEEDCQCVIVGYGPEREKYRCLIEELGIEESVLLRGRVDIEESALWMGSFDVGVHLVTAGKECSPVKVLCYMACGVASVVSEGVDGFADFRDGEYGLKVCGDDVEAVKEALLGLYRDGGVRDLMGKRGRGMALEKSWSCRARASLGVFVSR
jgi:glycosyltransferase involved in cell wall biosynthesis